MRRFYIRERNGKRLTVDISDSLTLEQKRKVFSRLADVFYAEEAEEVFWKELKKDGERVGRSFAETVRLLGDPNTPVLRRLLETA